MSQPKQMEVVDYYLGAEYFKSPLELREELLHAESLYNKNKTSKQNIDFGGRNQQIDVSTNKKCCAKKYKYSDSNTNTHILLYTDDSGVGGVAQYNHLILCQVATLGYQVSCVQETEF